MPPYAILPSLTRAPVFKGKRTAEDGTIADPAESGYVATRPRFTRLRRTFGVTYENLVAEDVRALDKFEVETVHGKAGAFWLPNLFPNASFENPGRNGAGVEGWRPNPSDAWTVSTSDDSSDGIVATRFATAAGVTASSTAKTANVSCLHVLKVIAGDSYQVNAMVKLSNTYGAGTVAVTAQIALAYSDGSTETLAVALLSTPSADYVFCSGSFTISASGGGAIAAAARVSFAVSLTGSGSGSAEVLLDDVGVALIATSRLHGRMPGSAPLARPVRFSKPPEIRDMKPAGGCKRYSADFEVTEL